MQSSYNIIKSSFTKESEKKIISTEYVVKNYIPEEIEPEEIEVVEEEPRIDPEEVLRKYEDIGKRIIQDAQREKEGMILKMQLNADKAEKEAYEETIEKAKFEAEEIINNAETLLKSARENYSEYLESKKTDVIKLALEIAGNITREKLSKENSMNVLIEEAFKISKGEESIIIKANSFHCEELKNNISKWKVQYSVKNDIFVMADDSMEKGNAILEKPSGIVKVGIDIGMEQIRKTLLG